MPLVLLLAILLIIPIYGPAQAQPSNLPQALKTLQERGAQTRYLGKRFGMDGYIAIFQGKEQYYYVTPDGKGFVMGLLFDQDGKMETLDQVRILQQENGDVLDILAQDSPADEPLTQAIEETSEAFTYKTPAQRMFADIQNSNWVEIGDKNAPVIYSFMDPQCPHCHSLMMDVKEQYIDKGLLRVRVIPVGFRQETLAQAAFLLASPNAQQLWYDHISNPDKQIPASAQTNISGVEKNLALLQTWKFDVTPLTVYQNKEGEIKIIRGRIGDLNALIADLE